MTRLIKQIRIFSRKDIIWLLCLFVLSLALPACGQSIQRAETSSENAVRESISDVLATATLPTVLPTNTPIPAPLAPTATSVSTNTLPAPIPKIDGLETVAFALKTDLVAQPLWVVATTGVRGFDPPQNHQVAIYTYTDETGWQTVSEITLPDPDYLAERSVQPVALEPDHLWLEVQGGIGANSSCYNLLKFDGQSLENALDQCGVVGRLQDFNGDSRPEVVINGSDRYIFCGACAVVKLNFYLYRWNGVALEEVTLTPLEADTQPAEIAIFNNRAVQLAQAGLWKEAHNQILSAQATVADNRTVKWNQYLISLHAETYAQYMPSDVYPLLTNIFYGDYATAIEIIRTYQPEEIFGPQSPLIVGTVAEGYESSLSSSVLDSTNQALTVKPNMAAAYFLRAWATYLSNPIDPAILADIEQAVALQPNDPLYQASLGYVRDN